MVTSAAHIVIRPFAQRDLDAVVALWQRCTLVVSAEAAHRDIEMKSRVQAELFLVATLATEVVGTVMAGYEGHRGWINYLAVSPDRQRHGIGRLLMSAAESRLVALGCPKINLQVRGSNTGVVEFYERLGFAVEDRVSMGKRLR